MIFSFLASSRALLSLPLHLKQVFQTTLGKKGPTQPRYIWIDYSYMLDRRAHYANTKSKEKKRNCTVGFHKYPNYPKIDRWIIFHLLISCHSLSPWGEEKQCVFLLYLIFWEWEQRWVFTRFVRCVVKRIKRIFWPAAIIMTTQDTFVVYAFSYIRASD